MSKDSGQVLQLFDHGPLLVVGTWDVAQRSIVFLEQHLQPPNPSFLATLVSKDYGRSEKDAKEALQATFNEGVAAAELWLEEKRRQVRRDKWFTLSRPDML